MTTKHTPGSWEIANGARVYAPGKAGPLLATIAYLPKAPGQEQANARLIAAAPDLLAALQGLMARIDAQLNPNSDTRTAARAAITKALGE